MKRKLVMVLCAVCTISMAGSSLVLAEEEKAEISQESEEAEAAPEVEAVLEAEVVLEAETFL